MFFGNEAHHENDTTMLVRFLASYHELAKIIFNDPKFAYVPGKSDQLLITISSILFNVSTQPEIYWKHAIER